MPRLRLWKLPNDPNRVLGGKRQGKKQDHPVSLLDQVRRPQERKVHTVSTYRRERRKAFMKENVESGVIRIGNTIFF